MARTANVYIDGEIIPEAYIWPDEIATSLHRVRAQIQAAGEFDDIALYIYSPGGYCVEGWAIHDYLLSLGKPINSIGYGQVASFATILFTDGATRSISPNCEFMAHLPWGMATGNIHDFQEYMDGLAMESDRIINHYAERTGLDSAFLSDKLRTDWIVPPAEAVSLGFATQIWQPAEPVLAHYGAKKPAVKKPVFLLSMNGRKVYGLAPKNEAVAYTDDAFLLDMIPHHQAGIEMANKILDVASHSEVADLAQRIIDTQSGEVAQMTDWLKNWYGLKPDGSAHPMNQKTEQSTNKTTMSKLKDAIKGILNLMDSEETGTPILNLDTALTDGTTLVTPGDMLVIGATATINGVPAPDGEYTTVEGGMVITVAGGIITDIQDPAETVAVLVADPAEVAALTAENAQMKAELAELKDSFSVFKAQTRAVLGLMDSQEVVTKASKDIAGPSARNQASPDEVKRADFLAARKAKGVKK